MRLAIYYLPDVEHPLWAAGCHWLGRDPGEPRSEPRGDLDPALAEPARYGFHATIVAPFELAQPSAMAAFESSLSRWLASRSSFDLPPLEVGSLSGFLALRPKMDLAASHPLRLLADACVLFCRPWQAGLSAVDTQRRLGQARSARQLDHVRRLGYPFVFEDWRFHFTLTGRLNDRMSDGPTSLAAWQERAQGVFAPALEVPLACRALCLCVELERGAPWLLLRRWPMACP